MNIAPGQYIGTGFYRENEKRNEYPIESSFEILTSREACKISGFWHRQTGMPKQTFDISIEVTDIAEIKHASINYSTRKLDGTFLSVNENITGLFKSKKNREILSVTVLGIKNGISINGVFDNGNRSYFNICLHKKDPVGVKTNVLSFEKYT
jgi:hypothetical protein